MLDTCLRRCADKASRGALSGSRPLLVQGHADEVNSVAFSGDGRLLASGSADKSLRMWDVSSGECCVVLEVRSYK